MSFLDASPLGHLIWLLPAAAAVAAWAAARRSRRLRAWVAAEPLRQQLVPNVSRRGRLWRHALLGAALVLLLVTAARPIWGEDLHERPVRSRDILLVIDTSRSMLATDVPPSRLRHAAFLARRLVDRFPGDRFGVIAFAGEANLICPLTPNRESLVLYLDQLSTETIPVGGTNMPAAFTVVQAAFTSGTDKEAADKYRAVVLITDGENLGDDPAPLLAELRDREVPVYTVGLGDPSLGSYIQLADQSFVVDADGKRVRTVLDEAGLRQIASATGGAYVHSTATADGLGELTEHLKQLLQVDGDAVSVWSPIERFQIPLAAAILLLLLRLLIPERQRAPRLAAATPAVAVVALFLLWGPVAQAQLDTLEPPPAPAPAAAPAGPTTDPRIVALREDVGRLSQLDDRVQRAHRRYELARRFDSLEATTDARQQYESVALEADAPPTLRAAALQNLGVLAHRRGKEYVQQSDLKAAAGQYTKAGEYYRESMRLKPADATLARNQELLLRDIRFMEELKRRQEELKQAQEEAKKQTQEALDKQQAAADSQASPEQSEADQQQANDATQAASEATRRSEQLADAMQKAQPANDARAAGHELAAAQSAQQQAAQAASPEERREQQEKAAQHLQNALAQLDPQDQQNEGSDGEGESENPPEQDGEPGEPQPGQGSQQPMAGDPSDQQPPDQAAGEGNAETPTPSRPPRDLKQAQAEDWLNEMQADEKDLMESIQQGQRAAARRRVQRDW